MINIKDKKNCCGCKACEIICPKNCIEMIVDEEGFWYPSIDKDKCVDCGICEKSCPVLNKASRKKSFDAKIYGAYSNNESIRINSSSGGMFSELATSVLEKNGAVFGCTMNDDFSFAKHIKVEDVDDLSKLQGSKYLQSDTNITFEEVKNCLQNGQKVIYSGTPCQIAGLKGYLKKSNTSDLELITVDFICHGVASSKIWSSYKENLEKVFKSKLKKVEFRNKTYGWKNFSLYCSFENQKTYKEKISDDLYLRGFVSDYYLRQSCYDCQFKGDNIKSDITLADFWGIDKVNPKFNDDKGASLVVIHSQKGQQIFDEIIDNEKITYFSENAEKGLEYNPSYYNSVKMKSMRKVFFKQFEKNGVEAFENCCGKSNKTKFIRKINTLKDKIGF